MKRLLNHHLPPVDACFADGMREIERVINDRPWKKLSGDRAHVSVVAASGGVATAAGRSGVKPKW